MIAARAILQMSLTENGLPFQFLQELLDRPPRKKILQPGDKGAMFAPAIGRIDMEILREGGLLLSAPGRLPQKTDPDPDESEHITYADIQPWLILSYFCAMPFGAINEDGKFMCRDDLGIMLTVGTCPMPLLRPPPQHLMEAIHTHEIEGHAAIVCPRDGIIEPITFSIALMLTREAPNCERFMETAVSIGSLPLLIRLSTALSPLTREADRIKAEWAQAMTDERIGPLIRDTLMASISPDHLGS